MKIAPTETKVQCHLREPKLLSQLCMVSCQDLATGWNGKSIPGICTCECAEALSQLQPLQHEPQKTNGSMQVLQLLRLQMDGLVRVHNLVSQATQRSLQRLCCHRDAL